MRLHSAMGLFLGHETLTDRISTNWVRVDLVRVYWHPLSLLDPTEWAQSALHLLHFHF